MKARTVSVTEFKSNCLALLDEIAEHGGTITITRRGLPLARVSRPRKTRWRSLEGVLAGKVDIPDELLMRNRADEWNCVREAESGVEID